MTDPGEDFAFTYLTVAWAGTSESGKTNIWIVRNARDGSQLGRVRWFGRWRKYAFEPWAGTIFEYVCLREIATFCEEMTKDHARGRRS